MRSVCVCVLSLGRDRHMHQVVCRGAFALCFFFFHLPRFFSRFFRDNGAGFAPVSVLIGFTSMRAFYRARWPLRRFWCFPDLTTVFARFASLLRWRSTPFFSLRGSRCISMASSCPLLAYDAMLAAVLPRC